MRIKFIIWDGAEGSDPIEFSVETGSNVPPVAGQIFAWPAAGYFLIIDTPDDNTVIAKNVGWWQGGPYLRADKLSEHDDDYKRYRYSHHNVNATKLIDKLGVIHHTQKLDGSSHSGPFYTAPGAGRTRLVINTLCWLDDWHDISPLTETTQPVSCLGCLYQLRQLTANI